MLALLGVACGEGKQAEGGGAGGAGSGGRSAGAAGVMQGGNPGAGTAGGGQAGAGAGGGGTSAGTTAGAAGAGAGAGGAGGSSGSATAGSAGALAGSGGAAGSTGGAGGGSGGGFGSETLALSNLAIERNPNMTISCFVSWTTPEPATSEVQFGEGGYQFRIRDDELVTEHRVLVIGMHAETNYQIKAFSGNARGTGTSDGTFMTGQLPNHVPATTLTKNDTAKTQPGWILTNIQASSFSAPATAVMLDQGGEVVWYYVHGTSGDMRGDVSTELFSDGVLVGPTNGEEPRLVDLSGAVTWEGPQQGTQQLMSHFAMRRPNGNFVLNWEIDKSAQNGSTRIDDQRIEEITPERQVVWSWTMFDHVEPSGTKEELCHGNHVTFDDPGGVVYYNCRWVGVFKIDRMSGEVLWRLGGTYDETSLGPGDFTFSPPDSKFSDAHEPEFLADGKLMLYDNGGYAGLGGPGGQDFHTRILEYEIDETTMTATKTFEFPGDFPVDAWYKEDWYAPFWGDTDQLANGNILVTAGVRSASASTRIFEITREGEVVWEITFPPNNGSYKAERLTPPPLVEAMP
ncbi:MAG TPA: aryl-sulfate sulfotransferase [Polyangiaceae bacterium]